jgi:hypothetical protein
MNILVNLPNRLVLLCICFFSCVVTMAQESAGQGDLILVESEYVIPEHRDTYVQWSKEFKAIADKTNFRSFWVDSDAKGFYYIFVVGKTLADFDAFDKEWQAYRKANPGVDELFKKYSHTLSGSKSELWRHSPAQSYTPAGYKPSESNGYTRFYSAVIKPGKTDEAVKILMEYKKTWTDSGVKDAYNIYWAVLGPENNSITVVDNYQDRQAWVQARSDVFAKVGEAKLVDLDKRWRALLVSENEAEGSPRADLTHIKK